jgi:hypothetical protein
MFWPDDNMWYLIEIHRVNVIDKTATIVYRWAAACRYCIKHRVPVAAPTVLLPVMLRS